MAKKCTICNNKIEQTFRQKPLGTYVRNEKGKQQLVCSSCQKKLTMDEIKEKL